MHKVKEGKGKEPKIGLQVYYLQQHAQTSKIVVVVWFLQIIQSQIFTQYVSKKQYMDFNPKKWFRKKERNKDMNIENLR